MDLRMKIGKAITLGVIGAAAMTTITWIARHLLNVPVNLEMLLGTWIGMEPGLIPWMMGFMVHLSIGAIFGIFYAWSFEYLSHQADWFTGLELGAVHTLFSGLLLGIVPAMHPMIPAELAAPGIFFSGLGLMGVIAFCLLHLMFGAILGSLYGSVVDPIVWATRLTESETRSLRLAKHESIGAAASSVRRQESQTHA
jgi:hypothetical protein